MLLILGQIRINIDDIDFLKLDELDPTAYGLWSSHDLVDVGNKMIYQTKDTPVGLSTEEARIEVDPQMLEVELHVPETQLPPVREGAEPAAQPSLGGVLVVISVVLDQFQGVTLEAEGLGTHNAKVPQVW